ncbi:MAG: hypothetical protein KF767_17285 [Bdellovibrionaceae bacterium]|nr:hypothetical protein [Pseudobdellovibrionaceae bacterium]
MKAMKMTQKSPVLTGLFTSTARGLAALLLIALPLGAWAQPALNYGAEVFDLDKKAKLADFKVEGTDTDGQNQYVARFTEAGTGKVLVEERATLKSENGQVVKVEIDQNQTGGKGVITFDGKKATFSKTEDGKTKTSDENVKGDFVVSGNFQRYVHSKWADLQAGKTVSFRYGVWERMETVGFQVSKMKDEDKDGAKTTLLKMKPSSFIIAALVNPIEFRFNEDGSRLLEMKGRIQVKAKDGSKFKDQDGVVVYKY